MIAFTSKQIELKKTRSETREGTAYKTNVGLNLDDDS